MNKLLLVDGHNLLFKMFFGMPFPFQNENGVDITGTVGFVGTVVKMIKYLQVTDCLVVFDGENSCHARKDSADYKSNRLKDYGILDNSQNPFTQLEFIKVMLDSLSIAWIETNGIECDDFVSLVASRNDGKTFISSTDTDFLQLINDNIKVIKFNGKNTIIIDEDYVFNKFGVFPKNYCLYKSLVGDKADNIIGVHKVGPKTAQKIINSLMNSINDKYYKIYEENISIINRNIELIKQPNIKFDIQVEENCYPVDYLKLKHFKPLRDINNVTKEIHSQNIQ